MLEIFLACMLFSIGAALVYGGAPERLGAAVVVLMAFAQFTGHQLSQAAYLNVDMVSLIVDLVGLLGMTAIALHANRIWPLWTAALQLLSCASHVGRDLSSQAEPLVYSILKSSPTFVVFILLMAGTLQHQLRVKRQGQDSPWTPSVRVPPWAPQFLRC